ncbi:hypothetical protein IFR04_004779 [Cadophora malorum]|uniref:Uncharacterized protein n=1 Tax=Cadophora malorum TaxID=108018 RepID=A0A8H7WC04_9HELO|nr:hypothetical protein IFR04_004779 [Cadophora malorum]
MIRSNGILHSHDENHLWHNPSTNKTQNVPFIEYLAGIGEEVVEDEADEHHNYEDGCVENDDQVEGQDEPSHDEEDGGQPEYGNEEDDIRRFMIGADDILISRDQVDLVANFCEKSKADPHVEEKRKHVALLDERCMHDAVSDRRGLHRPYLGPLTSQQLCERMSRKRFKTDPEELLDINVLEDEQHDAARRIVFITDLDALGIEALVKTAALTQVPTLRSLFYKYLTSTASMGVTVKNGGFRSFHLEFHIPYYVMRDNKPSRRDTRKTTNGDPLRRCWELPSVPFMSPSAGTKSTLADANYNIYEAMISIGVTGSGYHIWAAYAFVDGYFGSRDSVDSYHQMKGRIRGRAEPLAAGLINADEPLWDPREYFLKVLEIRTKLVSMEWSQILNKMGRDLEQARTIQYDAMLSEDPKAKKIVTKFMKWSLKMSIILRILEKRLLGTLAAWESFKRSGIYYFDDESVLLVGTAFEKLKAHLQRIRDLENELSKDNPDGLNIHLGLESVEGTNSQEKTARQLQNLTVITTIFFPLALSANLFSTTGVLPFAPNLRTFMFVFLVLGILILATLVILTKGETWLYQFMEYLRKIFTFCMAHLGPKDAGIMRPKSSKQAGFSIRFATAAPPEEVDVEAAIHNG